MSVLHLRGKRLSTLVNIAVIGLLGACTSRDSGRAQGGANDDTIFRVALLTPGPINDQAWNSGAYAGLLAIRDSLGARVSHIQTRTPADFEENFRQYGAEGYDLVFGHGFEFQDAAARVAPFYPSTVYITSSGSRRLPNLSPIVFGFEEACYLAGIVAGSLTRSGVIGAIAGTELPTVKTSFLAFKAGARSVRPDAKVITSYVGNWEDASAGKEQALAQIARGADIIFQNADAAGLGIFQAVKEANTSGGGRKIYAFGANVDQSTVAPDIVVASAVIDLPRAFLMVAREVKDGRFRSRVIYLGAYQDIVKLVVNPKLRHLVTPVIQARVDSAERAMKAGTLVPPRVEGLDSTVTR